VLVDDEEIIKVPVHTNHPGRVLEEALVYGSLLTVKVENMREQHTEIIEAAASASATSRPRPKKNTALSPCVPARVSRRCSPILAATASSRAARP
jgi:dihydroxyacetone kinase-like predicted kinase